MTSHRIAIIGAGAVGGYFGARFARAGLDVTFFDPWAEHAAQCARQGLTIEAMNPAENLRIRVDMRGIDAVQGILREAPIDIAFIAVKSYDTVWATHLILPYLAADGIVVSLQNSFNEPLIASIAGAERCFGCAIESLSCDLVAPGLVRRLSPGGSVAVGAMAPGRTAQLDRLCAVLSHADPARVVDDLASAKWSKLVINAMRNGLSAMTGMTGSERDSHPVTRALGIRLGAQTVQVGRALGLSLTDTGYRFDTLVAAGAGDPGATAEIHARMAEISAGRSSTQSPSMAQDIRKGRRTETDAINGLVARRGRELGIDTDPHERVHQQILRIERGICQPSPDLAEGIL